jgi:hypothetical protein
MCITTSTAKELYNLGTKPIVNHLGPNSVLVSNDNYGLTTFWRK